MATDHQRLKYFNDNMFHCVVNWMEELIIKTELSLQDVREALDLAEEKVMIRRDQTQTKVDGLEPN